MTVSSNFYTKYFTIISMPMTDSALLCSTLLLFILNTPASSVHLKQMSLICWYVLNEIHTRFLPPSPTNFIRPAGVQKVAEVALLTMHRQERNPKPADSFSTTEPFLCAPQMTRDVLHVPNIRHMWLFQRRTTWCHLCARHICSLLLRF